MELTREESKRILRRIELEAYSALVTALRAQGELDRRKKTLLRDLAEQLSISTERHRAEIRRAISDDRLSMIAECVCGSDASVEWESEGRRVVPLMPRLVPQTAFTGCATAAANHAASVNSTIPSTLKGQTKDDDDDEDYRSRKRQRPSSPVAVQKVIVSSATKTTPSTTTVRSNNITVSKDSSRLIKTPSLSVKQERGQHSSIKMTSSGGVSSKANVSGGSKSSSVSVAPSKYVAPLPASCLQAHASVVSGNKNRMNLNVVKTKQVKPKSKTLTAPGKIKSTGISVASSVVQTVAQSLLSIAKTATKDNELLTTATKTISVSRSTSTITVAPRSSISLTTFKSNVQTKPNTQSSPSSVRNVEGIPRPNTAQLGKAVSVSRRPLPTILPKTIPPKALTTVSSPGRKLASILPAPAKTTSSSLPSSLIVPVVVTSSSSPVPIAPSPRPPQTCNTSITSSLVNKVTTVSMVTGQRDNQGTSVVLSPVLCGKSPGDSQDSSPISCKSLDSIHERETLSPVNDILTLVTSPSSVPFVPSSPVKALPNPTHNPGEISLECDENLLEDFVKDDDVTVKNLPSVSSTFSKDNSELNLDLLQQDFPNDNDVSRRGHSLQHPNKTSNETEQVSKDKKLNKTSEVVSSPIDLSPLVSELISSSSFGVDKKEFENLDSSDLLQTNTAGGNSVVGGNSSELFVGKFPVLDLGFNASEKVKSDVNDVSLSKEEEEIIAGKMSVDIEQETGRQKENGGSLTNENQKLIDGERAVSSEAESAPVEKSVLSSSKDLNISDGVKDLFRVEDPAKCDQKWSSGNEIENRSIKNTQCVETLGGERLRNNSKHDDTKLSDLQKNDEKFASTTSSNISSLNTTDSRISQDTTNKEQCRGEDTSSEKIKTTVEERPTAVSDNNLTSECIKDKMNKTEGGETNEMITSIIKEESHEVFNEDPLSSNTTEKQESCITTETQVTQESKDDDGKSENIDEQLSGSELSSPEGNLLRTSNRKRKAPPPRDLSVHPPGWVRSALQLLQKVSRFRGSSRSKNARNAASWFLKPVATSEAPGYYKVIKNPMDFGTIKTKLETSEYKTPADFQRDMLLVKSNCCKYNPPGHIVRKDCDEVFQFYEGEYEKFLEKLDKIYLPTSKKQKPFPI